MMDKPEKFPQQKQSQPGREHKMRPEPEIIRKTYRGSGKLDGKVALITGGDSGIGRSVAVHFAREGAAVAIVYLEEARDAEETKKMVENEGQKCLLLEGDVRTEKFCRSAVARCVQTLGRLNILVNNAAVQFPKNHLKDISADQLKTTFETNIYPYFYMTTEALKHLN
jgi:NAD(P)-dependent dehydrogenase (short-subunit alcohol dehydrogenase family)